ncbi:spermidine synthase [Cohnella sp. GCM10027633]|uniref:spermidine synthase n=1 Tax=unclassified Cohnella TaxID=2636738 RepID=UPI00363D1411
MHVLARESSEHNEITVYETGELYGETGRFRCMRFADDAVQGAIDLRRPERVVLAYQRAVIGLLEALRPALRSLFVIGHGVGTIPMRFANRNVVVAEIDRAVVELSRTYFDYKTDNVRIGDGGEWLAREDDGAYDAIVADAFTRDGTPRSLTTPTFFRTAASKLAPGGVLLFNLFGKPRNDKRIGSVYAALADAFPHAAAFAMAGDDEEGNLVLVGGLREFGAREIEIAGCRRVSIERGYVARDSRG